MTTIKKFILTFVFLLFSTILLSQQQYPTIRVYANTIGIVLQASDWGLGVRYDRQLPGKLNNFGLYGTYAHGNYAWNNEQSWIKDHRRYSGGVTIKLLSESIDPIFAIFSLGAVYHTFGEQQGTNDLSQFNPKALDPLSFEVGAGAQFNRFSGKFRYDWNKQEVCLDITVSFNFDKRNKYQTWTK